MTGKAKAATPPEALRILASFKPVPSAFQLDGEGDGGQMTLVFDASQVLPATQAWATYAGRGFLLAFEPEPGTG